MITASEIFSDLLILGLALWGQSWKGKAERARDALQFMIEEEADAELAEDLED